jgi:hypothetical protein
LNKRRLIRWAFYIQPGSKSIYRHLSALAKTAAILGFHKRGIAKCRSSGASDDRRHELILIIDDPTGIETNSDGGTAWSHRDERSVLLSLYSDRGSYFFVTVKAGDKDKHRLTEVGRALKELGVQMIAAYSPQAQGQSERSFGTWRERLPQELRAYTDPDDAALEKKLFPPPQEATPEERPLPLGESPVLRFLACGASRQAPSRLPGTLVCCSSRIADRGGLWVFSVCWQMEEACSDRRNRLILLVAGEGFEPSTSGLWVYRETVTEGKHRHEWQLKVIFRNRWKRLLGV